MGNIGQDLRQRSPNRAPGSEPAQPYQARPTPAPRQNEYAELKQLIKQKGLLHKQPSYYTGQILLILSLLALSLTFVVLIDTLWLQLLNAAFLAFVFAQIGFIGHDAGHRQIFGATGKNEITGLAVNFLLGTSRSWWIDKHNRHHSNPNQLDVDPDISIPVLAFSEEQARTKRGVLRFVVRYQAYLLFPLLALEGLGLRVASFHFMARTRTTYILPELFLATVHFVLYFGFLFSVLSVWQATAFIVVHQALFGLYVGSTFAINHKGMLILDKDSKMDFLRRQVLTSRNVKPNPLIDFWYGGLNYQIEHHLFPNMPRNKLPEARKIVKAFCQAHSVSYCEESVLQSYREVLQSLHQVGVQGALA
jgi:fatty acid desaturase